MAFLCLDNLTRNSLRVLFNSLIILLSLQNFLIAFANGYFLLWPDLFSLLLRRVTTNVKLWLICLYKILAPCLWIKDLSVCRCRANRLAGRLSLRLIVGRLFLAWALATAVNRNATVPLVKEIKTNVKNENQVTYIAAVVGTAGHF